ncbi:MAG: hypothetical protein V3T48_02300, partial [Vicinamibacterales bacterium]
PDGQWLGFWANGQLKKIAVSGGAAVILGDAENLLGASWGADDMIVFGQGAAGIWRVSGTGGTPELIVEVAEGEAAHGPQMLPGGDGVLFTLLPRGAQSWDRALIVVQSLSTGERTVVVEGGRDARYVSTRHLVYALGGVLLAVPFDVDGRTVTSGPVPLVEGVAQAPALTGAAHFALSNTGTLAYIHGDEARLGRSDSRLGWVDRQGRPISQDETANFRGNWPRLSPDGTRVASVIDNDVWLLDLDGGADTRLTEDGLSVMPSWTPDGSGLTFTVTDGGAYARPADLSLEAAPLSTNQAGGTVGPTEWSPDGQTLVFHLVSGGDQRDLWMSRRDGEPEPFLATEFSERTPRLSPDGRWVAYVSDQAGDDRVYVQPFPAGGRVVPISAGGGTEPVWSRDGQELFFRDGPRMLVVEVSTEPAFEATNPRVLFEGDYLHDPVALGIANYDVSPDGERFLMATGDAGGLPGVLAPVAVDRSPSPPRSWAKPRVSPRYT